MPRWIRFLQRVSWGSDQFSIVSTRSRDYTGSIKGFIVWQETHAVLDGTDLPLRFRNCQAKTIAALGTRHSVPKLSNVLVRVVKSGALGGKSSECRVHELMLGSERRVIRSWMLVSTRHDAMII